MNRSQSPTVDLDPLNGEGTYVVDLTDFNDATWDKCNPINGLEWTRDGEDDDCLNQLTVILAV